jgi:orotate phosphoribosyltransferase
VAIALAEHHGISKPYAFDRKEIKDHGEGGLIVGAPLAGRVLVIDDVISAGVSIEHGANIIKAAGATMAGIVISMDRQERTQHGELSAVGEVERKYQAPVLSVAKLADLLHYLQQNRHQADNLARVRAYNETYGAKQS